MRLYLIAILSVGQIIGWGTTFYLPSVMADDIARDLGMARELIFVGVALMVALGGLMAPACGKLMDRHGAAVFLPCGSLLIGLGLIQFAAIPSVATSFLAWGLFGLATPLSLSLAAVTLLAQLSGAEARRNIAVLMLFTGLSASVSWPIASILVHAFTWRGALAVFAGLNLLLALPMHLALAWWSRGKARTGARGGVVGASPARLPAGLRQRARYLMVTAFCLQGLGSWGLPLHVIALFEQLGLPSATAVGIAALNGPATIAARLLEVALAGRVQPITTAVIAAAHIPAAFLLLLAPLDPVLAALGFTVIFFAANGVMSVLRATLPLTLLGASEYGALMGALALPQNLVFAAAPALFAVALHAAGPVVGVLLALTLALAALATVVSLALTVHTRGHSGRAGEHA